MSQNKRIRINKGMQNDRNNLDNLDVSVPAEIPRARPPLKIFIFTWNTESVRIGESLDVDELKFNRTGILARFRFPAEIADFLPYLIQKIQKSEADIVVIGFQEDASPGNYMHSHILTEEMPKYGYRLVSRGKMMGIGATTYKALKEFDFKMRGLRMSVYAKNALAEGILSEEETLIADIGSSQKYHVCRNSYIFRNKGAIASYVRVPHVGTIAFVNVHLPFNSESIMNAAIKKDPMIRNTEVLFQNICYNDIYRNLILDLRIPIDYVFMFGDFNYRNSGCYSALMVANEMETRPSRELFQQFYLNCDELHAQMVLGGDRSIVYPLQEGVNNEGPMFLPTGKLSRNRPEGYADMRTPRTDEMQIFRVGVGDQRTPSWLDRILYNTLNTRRPAIKCEQYDRFDVGYTMKKSDHAAVYGVYTV